MYNKLHIGTKWCWLCEERNVLVTILKLQIEVRASGLFCFQLQKNAIKACISEQSSQKEQLSGPVTGLQVKCVCVVKKWQRKLDWWIKWQEGKWLMEPLCCVIIKVNMCHDIFIDTFKLEPFHYMKSFLTCSKRVGVVRWSHLLSAGAVHPELVLWSWTEVVKGYDVSASREGVPVTRVPARTFAHYVTNSWTYTHFDPIDQTQLWTLDVQLCRVCAHWKRDCCLNWQWIYETKIVYTVSRKEQHLNC